MTRWVAVLVALVSVAAAAQDGGTLGDAGSPVPETVAILQLQANAGGQGEAAPVATLIAAQLSERAPSLKVITQQDIATLVGVEQQKQLLGASCSEDGACLTELSGAVGARYLVSGRLDRFGQKYSLTTSLFDSRSGQVLARPHAEAMSDDALPDAASTVAHELLVALGREKEPTETERAIAAAKAEENQPGTGADVGIHVGNNFIEGLSQFAPAGDLQLGYRFDPAWVGFLDVGFNVVLSKANAGGVSILPTVLGARHFYRVGKKVQPYWGLGLGVQLAIGPYGIFQQTGPLPTVLGMVGVQWLVLDWFAVGIEGSTNVAQAVLGLTQNSDLGSGFNLKPALTFTFRP